MNSLDTQYSPIIAHPTLAIHGSAGNGRQLRALEDFGYFSKGFYSPDIAGYEKLALLNQSPVPSLEERIICLKNQIAKCEGSVHLFGHSFGCTLAAELMLAIPERIISATFYEPVIPGLLRMSGSKSDADLLATLVNLWNSIRTSSTGNEIRLFLDYWAGTDIWQKLPADKKQKLRSLAKPTAADFEQAISLSHEQYSRLPKTIPTQIIVGSASPAVSQRMSEIAAEVIPVSWVKPIQGLGHMGPVTHPELVFPSVIDHLTEVESKADDSRKACITLPITTFGENNEN